MRVSSNLPVPIPLPLSRGDWGARKDLVKECKPNGASQHPRSPRGGRPALNKWMGGRDKYLLPRASASEVEMDFWRIRNGESENSPAPMQRLSGNRMAGEWWHMTQTGGILAGAAVRWKERPRVDFLHGPIEPGGSFAYPRFEGCRTHLC
ncbi:hypothetical protein U0070_001959 [Myodes glareolus]|uniref:Uncharacterized protein n=1 Tax=Myodes glareolus TaxID=447135 RepID=A0AAW0H1I3_MYOGA